MASGPPPFFPRGIRGRLFLLIALALLPMVLLQGWIYLERYRTRQAQALQTELEVAQGVATTFAAYAADVRRMCAAVGEAIVTYDRYTREKATRLLAFNAQQYRSVRNLSWVAPGGTVLASSDPPLVGRSFAGRLYFREILAGRGWALGELTPAGIATNRPTFAIATAVRREGVLLGVVVAGIEPDELDELTLTLRRPAEGVYAIFDNAGRVVFRSADSLAWSDRVRWKKSDPLLRRALETGRPQAGTVRLEVPGGEWFSARVPIAGTGWVAGAGRPVDAALAPVHERLIRDATLAALIASAAFLLAWLVSRTIARPLQLLEADARAMGEGRIETHDDRLAPEEVRRLRRTVEEIATRLVRRAEALQKSEERYRLVNLATNDVVWDWDLASGELLWNRALETVFGYPPDDVPKEIGWWYDRIHPDERDRVVASLHAVLDGGGGTWSEEYRFRKHDGTWAAVLDRGHIHRDGAGRPLRMVGSMLDLTERRCREEALRESEERFRTLADNIAQLAWMADGKGSIFWYNRRWFDYTGTTLAEVQGWGWRKVHHPDHVGRVVEKIGRCFETGEIWEDTFPLRGGDGRYRWFLSRAVPIRDEGGKVACWFGTNTDVTEQREAEEALRRLTDELERRVGERTADLTAANRELEAFTYSVSHDLRAPLRHITGFVELLGASAEGALDENGRRYVRIISDSARRLETLIDDLLAFSRIGRASVNAVPVPLERLVEESRKELAPEEEGRRIEWRIDPLPQIQGDPALLRTVTTNLLANALKYTRGRDPAVIEIGCEEGADEVVCHVRDNGAGFDMRYADRLFGVFQRLHRAEDFEGTGIGLASVKRIVERHGGRVWAEGEVDRGAAFYFALPRKYE